jgi:hypothetical protein
MKTWKLPLALAALALGACSSAVGPDDSGAGHQRDATPSSDASDPPIAVADAGPEEPRDAMSSDGAPLGDASADSRVCEQPPLPNQCVNEGCDFAPFTLPSCSREGGEVQFYDQTFCSAQATLLVIVAGWSMPCQMQAPQIERQITQGGAYQDRVRVINVIAQNPDYSQASGSFCRSWQDRYRLTSTMVIDPAGVTQRYFPDMAVPAHLIIDRHGRIRYRAFGADAGLTELRAALDNVLAHP